ncbi:MAG: alpha-L-arabinofuranosidase [Verrucomicrobia bacterium]|nr:alpha-L-arabinofuranosidase [Verrucomicrobiota bacterium]
MKTRHRIEWLLAAVTLAGVSAAAGIGRTITIDATQGRTQVSPSLYGIFFEEINHAGDGGLYAEMVQNRDFEINTLPGGASWAGNLLRTTNGWQERKWFGNELHGWSLVNKGSAAGFIRQDEQSPLNERNPHSLRLVVKAVGHGIGIVNGGYWGMNVQAGQWYDLSFFARTAGDANTNVGVALESASGRESHATTNIEGVGGGWRQYRCSLKAQDSDPNSRLVLTVDRPGTVWFDMVSLFPRATFKNRPNGLRPDLVRLLADLKPAFMRFPGGAIVGGMTLDNRIQWQNSIGPLEQRRGTANLWGYWTSNGLGFHEYLQLCEDLGAEALWVCNPGFSDNYRNAEIASPAQVKELVQEALDAIEYALGPANTGWGARRAANGHPAPFPLRYVEIGNEAGGDLYATNYRQFHTAIHAKYPALTLICNERLKDQAVEMVDDHKYGSPADFFGAYQQYDAADRRGPTVYVGEFGCNSGVGAGNLLAALAEAAYRLGLERNSDVVRMSSYAPLFFHVKDIQWPVNMIGFDSSRVAPRTSYFVQQMLACNRPDEILQTQVEPPAAPADVELLALAGLERKTGDLLLRVVNRTATPRTATIRCQGLAKIGSDATITTLSHDDPTAENTLDFPDAVLPLESAFAGAGAEFSYVFKPYSFTLLRLTTE